MAYNIQFSFFPGDPGEDDQEFDSNWTAEAEPVRSFRIEMHRCLVR